MLSHFVVRHLEISTSIYYGRTFTYRLSKSISLFDPPSRLAGHLLNAVFTFRIHCLARTRCSQSRRIMQRQQWPHEDLENDHSNNDQAIVGERIKKTLSTNVNRL